MAKRTDIRSLFDQPDDAGLLDPAAARQGGGSGDHGGGPPAGGGGNGNGGGGGGGGGSGGTTKGDLYGDQYILLRDLDPTNGGGNGEPVLDANGQPILIGTNGQPIYFVAGADGDYEIPADQLAFVQTVELERANVARAPSKVMDKSLSEALGKIEAASILAVDPAGRLVCDGATIDSPLENLALYQYLMTAGGDNAWPAVTAHWPPALQALLGDNLLNPDWDPSSLLGAAFSKESPITLDAVIYENTVLGVNGVTQAAGSPQIDYFDFSATGGETYSYDRDARYADVWLEWYADTDGNPANLERVQSSLLEAVFGNTAWSDRYLEISGDPTQFAEVEAPLSGLNDFAQATDDARAIINFIHETGAIRIAPPEAAVASASLLPLTAEAMDDGHDHESTLVLGTRQSDEIHTGGGAQTILAGNGKDIVTSGGGPDHVEGGNGKDWIEGGGGPDTLDGGNGKDVLIGGAGPDELTGGQGADRFVYLQRGDAPAHGGDGGPRLETITDFQVAIDTIDFSALDATLHFSDTPDAYAVWVSDTDEGAMVHVDLDGQTTGEHPDEMSILLQGVSAADISADNFIL